jgi:hypothetical protein
MLHTLAEAMLTDWFRAPGREVERVETFGPRAGAYEQVYRLTRIRREAACACYQEYKMIVLKLYCAPRCKTAYSSSFRQSTSRTHHLKAFQSSAVKQNGDENCTFFEDKVALSSRPFRKL